MLGKNNVGVWGKDTKGREGKKKNHPSMMVSSSKVSGMVNFLSTVNIDILGISELKWTRMGEFNSDNHYIYYYGQESFRRNGVALIINKRV